MTLQETHSLKKLDVIVTSGRTAIIETQYGEVWVGKTRHHGYVAEVLDQNQHRRVVWDATPSTALLSLGRYMRLVHG